MPTVPPATRTAIDLFAGAGGLSNGISQAGFHVVLGVEQDAWASETYRRNHANTQLVTSDIALLGSNFFKRYKGVDLVAGGPPCQGFSIAAANRRNQADPRNLLYLEFLRVVGLIEPRAVLMENVKGMESARLPDGRLVKEDILRGLVQLGYYPLALSLNALSFGVPQTRARSFIVAAKEKGQVENAVNELLASNANTHATGPSGAVGPVLWPSIGDLPAVVPREVGEDAVLEYDKEPENEYQRLMRHSSERVHNHVPMKHTPRMVRRFEYILQSMTDGSKLPLPEEHSPRKRGNPLVKSAIVFEQNHRRLYPDRPSPTITASFYSSFIHPFQPRNLTVREAARLQSFPDSFIFCGKRTTLSKKLCQKKGYSDDLHLDQFNQVGNAVPPLLATAIANSIKSNIFS